MAFLQLTRRAEPLSWLILVVAALFALWGPISEALGRWEGRTRPVLDPTLTVISMTQTDRGTQIAGEAVKVRGGCEYIPGSLEWWFGTKEGPRVIVPAHFTDQPMRRTAGPTRWTGIVVALGPENIRSMSYATVKHDCGRPWPITSLFYVAPPLQRSTIEETAP